MVCGAICDVLPVPEVEAVDGALLVVLAAKGSNGVAAVWLVLADCDDDSVDAASDWKLCSSDDAAPRANSMTELRTRCRDSGQRNSSVAAANAVPGKNIPKNKGFPSRAASATTANDAAPGRIFRVDCPNAC
ncbi:hypothetical protein [Bradyrhizobium sp.]|uniref:hypothetical protein n=1 Tax=Bradyrhizobium sp. TaxID=376 RepID=UPI003C32547F